MKKALLLCICFCIFLTPSFAQNQSLESISRSDFVTQAVQALVGEVDSNALLGKVKFADVASNSPTSPLIQYAFENGALSMPTDQRFFPDRAITRAEAIKVLIALLDITPLQETERSHFLDIKMGMWSDPFVRSAEALCLISSDRIVFLPDFLLTPQTAAEWTNAALQIKEQDSACPVPFELPPPPLEVNEVPELAKISAAVIRPTVGFVLPDSIPRNASNVPFLSLTLTAPTTEAVTLDFVRITRQGLGDRNDFVGVKVLENGQLRGNSRKFSADQIAELNLSYDPVQIAAGESATLVIAADLDAAEGGGEYELVIAQSEDIVITGVESGEQIAISGAFPIGSSTIDSANVQTAQLGVEFEPVRNTLRYGRKRAEIARIRISEVSGESAADITSMRLSFDGMADGGLKNLFVELDGNIVSSILAQTEDRKAQFSFPSGAISIDRGDDLRLVVKADIYVIDNDFRVFFDDLSSDLQTSSPRR